MNDALTEMIFVLDASGSMHGLERDTIGGFNSMIDRQRSEAGDALVSTVIFSDNSRVIHDRVDVRDVRELTERDYTTEGCTALYDAIGGAIQHIGNVHKYARPEDVPGRTVVVITTDGMENASRRCTAKQVKGMIERQKEKYGWEFVFLGANIDAAEAASEIGIEEEDAIDFVNDADGIALNCMAVGEVLCAARDRRPRPASWRSAIDKDFAKRGKA